MDNSNRIPADKSHAFGRWNIPEVQEGQVIESERLQKRGTNGELVDIDKNEVLYRSFTAGQLEDITQQCYDEVREQAQQEGYQAGLEQGQREGLAKGQQQINDQLALVESVLDQLNNALQAQREDVEQAILNLVSCVSKAIVRRELSAGSDQIHSVVREAIAALPLGSENIAVYLNPADYAILNEHKDLPEAWQVLSDSNVSAGGCRVQTTHSVIDFTLETQFQQTINTLVADRFAELAVCRNDRDGDVKAD